MHQAANVARAQGNVPGAVVRTLEDAHRSRLDWHALLRRFMLDTAENDYTWSVPNRRFIDSGAVPAGGAVRGHGRHRADDRLLEIGADTRAAAHLVGNPRHRRRTAPRAHLRAAGPIPPCTAWTNTVRTSFPNGSP